MFGMNNRYTSGAVHAPLNPDALQTHVHHNASAMCQERQSNDTNTHMQGTNVGKAASAQVERQMVEKEEVGHKCVLCVVNNLVVL